MSQPTIAVRFFFRSLQFFLPSHFIFLLISLVSHVVKHKLEGHLLRCNSRQPDEVYYHRDLHLDPGSTATASNIGLLRATTPTQLAAIVTKIEAIHEKLGREEVLQERILAHPQLQEGIKEATRLGCQPHSLGSLPSNCGVFSPFFYYCAGEMLDT